ncbi:MAG: ferrochelatase [Deltaproteobacteria bacterium]|nr:ferrochelatase [Deltaproteobacteria bacterium]
MRATLLVNIGSPEAPTAAAVRPYLRSFLGDPRVMDMPAIPRWLLVNGLIAPFRAPASARKYAEIWTPEGSPLTVHGRALARALGATYCTRYGRPSLDDALDEHASADEIVVVPLYPQYAGATTGSTLDALGQALSRRARVPAIRVVPPFWNQPAFLDAVATVARPVLDEFRPDAVLFSYHGLPESQVRPACERGPREGCCDQSPPPFCYRAQCVATTRLLAVRLGVDPRTSFQSRLGPAAWIGPSTQSMLASLPAEGIKRLAVITPSFVADCLETLHELGVEGAAEFRAHGGEELRVVPCVNSHPAWVEGLRAIVGGDGGEEGGGRREDRGW